MKFVQSDQVFSMLFTFDPERFEAGRWNFPDEPFLNDKEVYAVSVVAPQAMPASPATFAWEGKEYVYINLDLMRQMVFTLQDPEENEIIIQAPPRDFVPALNNGQVRLLTPQKIWPNASYMTQTDPTGLVNNLSALIFEFWYK